MSSHEVGPEWVLSSFAPRNRDAQEHIRQLIEAARRLWPRIRAHAIRQSEPNNLHDAIPLASDVWESALQSVGKTVIRKNGRGVPIRDLDAYLFGVFIHRFNRALKKERRRRQVLHHFPTHDLELLQQSHNSKAVREIEQSVQVKEVITSMDEWSRKVWVARKYGYSWHEIAVFFGMTDAQAKLKFRYTIARLRKKLGL